MRFEEFSGEWQESNLSNLVKLFGGYAFSSSDSKSFGIPWLKIANVGKNGTDWSDASYLPEEFWTSYKDYRLYKGDYVMALTRPILNHILKISIVDKKALLNQRVAKLIFSTNPEYGYQLLQRRCIVDKIENELAGTDPPNLGSGNLKNINISITLDKDEQSKIGNFFKQLDHTISLHQQELTTLKQTKQGFLQKMFPKEGESVPEIRFPGFTGDWEQHKLGEVADIVRGASPRPIQDPKWFDDNSDVGWLRISDVTEQEGRIYYLEQRISKAGQEKTRVLIEPHLLLSIAATVGKPVVNYVKTGVHDGFLIFQNPKFDREFMFQWLEMFRPKWQQYGQPGSQVNLNSNLVKDQEVMLPGREEQKKISDFFTQLDNLIALHQRELDILKETKKAFLQKMFV